MFDLDRNNVSNEKLITLIQFLQTLDEDNNPDNNIQISKDVQESFKNYFLDFKQDSNLEDEIKNILVDIKKDLVTKDNALKHYKKTLEKKFNIQLITNPTVEEEIIEVPEVVQVEEESEVIEEEILNGFSYETQSEVEIEIFTNKDNLSNKQILIYEKMSVSSTPVGDIEQLETLIISTIFNSDSELKISHTLGNHINNVWISIPYYGLY